MNLKVQPKKIALTIVAAASVSAIGIVPLAAAETAASVSGTSSTSTTVGGEKTKTNTAAGVSTEQKPKTTTNPTSTTTDAQRVQAIISKGDQEITRRLTSLNGLLAKINASTKLSASSKATLLAEVNTEISGLTTLKAKLDAETTVAGVRADAQSIISGYRVYALVLPKSALVKASDDQQVAEAKLKTLITKLQERLTKAKAAGKDVTSLQATLDDMTAKVNASTAISSSLETKVINLQPSDYNSDHTVLSGDATQLKAAHADNEAALNDAKTIVAGIKNL